jgi:hypothetical protein
MTADLNNYAQINFQNVNSGDQASADFVITADNGDDSSYFINMGITSSGHEGYHDDFFANVSSFNDGYLYDSIHTHIYECHIPPLLRFFHIQKISPSGWIALPKKKVFEITVEDKKTT